MYGYITMEDHFDINIAGEWMLRLSGHNSGVTKLGRFSCRARSYVEEDKVATIHCTKHMINGLDGRNTSIQRTLPSRSLKERSTNTREALENVSSGILPDNEL